MNPLADFFASRSIVLVGASRTPGRLGHTLAQNLVNPGYSGLVQFVNPKGGELLGRPLYPSLGALPEQPDLAVLLVPAAIAPETVAACGRQGIRRVILASGGFGELGPEGARLEADLALEAEKHGVRVLGPNCIGIIDAHRGLDTTFLAGDPATPGSLGVVSQSGALCAAIIDQAGSMAPGFSRMVSLGNQVDLDAADALEAMGSDPNTRAILLYLESVRDGARLLEVASRIAPEKPIIALKVGRSAAARAAAQSHTGALAVDDRVVDAAFRRAGIIRVDSIRELVEAGRVAALTPPSAGNRLAILTNAGGPGVAATDRAERLGLEIASLAPGSVSELRDLLPPSAGLGNPVDVLPSSGPTEFGASLKILLADPGVDRALIILPRPPGHEPAEIAVALAKAASGSGKSVVVVLMGGAELDPARRVLSGGLIPVFDYPEDAVRAMAHAAAASGHAPVPVAAEPVPLPSGLASGWLSYGEALGLAGAAGIPVEAPLFAANETEARDVAAELRFPIALKAQAPSALHKSDVGGVRLHLSNADEVVSAFGEMSAQLPDLEGIWMEGMAPEGVDLIVGAVRDPDFGPVVMVGAGGTAVEEDADVAMDLAPLDQSQAMALVLRTRAGRSLRPGRGRTASDVAAAAEAVVAVGRLIAGVPRIAEVEVNPLRVFTRSVRALDARVRLTGA